MLKLADTSLILINPSPSNVKGKTKGFYKIIYLKTGPRIALAPKSLCSRKPPANKSMSSTWSYTCFNLAISSEKKLFLAVEVWHWSLSWLSLVLDQGSRMPGLKIWRGALCVEMGFTWTWQRNQDATMKLKSELISIKF